MGTHIYYTTGTISWEWSRILAVCWAHCTFDLYRCLITFLIFLWCWTDDLSFSHFPSYLLLFSLCFSRHPFFIITPFSSSLPGSLCHPLHVCNLSQSSLCSAYDVLQFNLRPLWAVVAALLMVESTGTRQKEGKMESGREKETEVKKLIPESTQTPPPSWQIWDLIGSSLLHVFCLVMLFVAYSWSEFK